MLPSDHVIVGSAGDRRVTDWQAALSRRNLPPARLVTYQSLVTDGLTLVGLNKGEVLRVESPGKSAATDHLLLQLGMERVEPQFEQIDPAVTPPEKGRIFASRQWFYGLCACMDIIDTHTAIAPPHRMMNGTAAIRTMFDKRATQQILQTNALPIPQPLPPIHTYDELRAEMDAHNIRRVFIKLAHGSSASGAVAFETNGRHVKATTTAEQTADGRLYNSRKVRVLRDAGEIRRLVDTLGRHRLHVEQWIPKASLHGQSFDIRIVVINGNAQHSIVRLSRTPFTNLHLLNDRAPIETLIDKIGEERWREVQRTAERAVACFPTAFYAGVDILFTPDFGRHHILELNAFGDLLPTVRINGMTTYDMELQALCVV